MIQIISNRWGTCAAHEYALPLASFLFIAAIFALIGRSFQKAAQLVVTPPPENNETKKTEALVYPQIVDGPPSKQIQESFGFYNGGNNCFINAVLQVIFSSPFLVGHLVYGKGQNPALQAAYLQWKSVQENGSFTERTPDLASPLRSLNAAFEGSGQHDTAEFLVQALITPLELENNPLFFPQKQIATYKNPPDDEAVRKTIVLDANGIENRPTSLTHSMQLVFPESKENVVTMEELIQATFVENNPPSRSVTLTNGKTQELEISTIKTQIAPPEFLFVDLKRFNSIRQKIQTKVSFQEHFYIPPEFDIDGKGAKYEWVSFTIHDGGFGGGHYIAYVHHENGCHYYSDNAKLEKSKDEFLQAGKDFYLGFAKRVECTDVQNEIDANRYKGYVDKAIGNAKDTIEKIKLFNTYLDEKPPVPYKLKQVYLQLDQHFKDFVAQLFPDNPEEHLPELKAITDVQLREGLSGPVMKQYEAVRTADLKLELPYARDYAKECALVEQEIQDLTFLQKASEEPQQKKIMATLSPSLTTLLQTISVDDLLKAKNSELAALNIYAEKK
ncbi:MAG: hypothetical protein KDK71_00750 [Chlamydiia bacterium]|nr:hypothetical protein [Chlamydiia bacterium]